MSGDPQVLHVLTPSFPPRRPSVLFPRLRRAPNAPSAINCDRRPRSRLWRVSGADTGSSRRRAAGSVRGWCMCGRTWYGRLSKASRVDCGARSSYATGAFVRNYDLDFLKHFSMVIGFLARSEEHTSELQSLMRISYDVFCLNKHNT